MESMKPVRLYEIVISILAIAAGGAFVYIEPFVYRYLKYFIITLIIAILIYVLAAH